MFDIAKEQALTLIRRNIALGGINAGGGGAYPQVWARDAVITGLGVMATRDVSEPALLGDSLQSLAKAQSRLGRVPNHVTVTDGGDLVTDTMFAGAVDPSLWFIIGHYLMGWHNTDIDAVHAAYRWLEYQDANECGLLEVHESMDWADLFANRYNSLLPNVLWYAANKVMADLADRQGADVALYADRAEDIRYKINQLLWVGPEVTRDRDWMSHERAEWQYSTQLADTVLISRPWYLAYMTFRGFGDRCDTLGNLLAILFGVASRTQAESILDYIRAAGLDQPWPVKASWPPIVPGDPDWREYYRNFNLNLPHQYHNGGAWPYLGGFYVAALVKTGRQALAEEALSRLVLMNQESQRDHAWEFNEWFHGMSGQPMGHPFQSWSAGMLLYALESVSSAAVPFFSVDCGWSFREPPAST